MDLLFFYLNLCPSGEPLIFEWQNGLKINGTIDTFFDTSSDSKKCQAIVFRINHVLSVPKNEYENTQTFMEITRDNLPSYLFSKNGVLIWSQ